MNREGESDLYMIRVEKLFHEDFLFEGNWNREEVR